MLTNKLLGSTDLFDVISDRKSINRNIQSYFALTTHNNYNVMDTVKMCQDYFNFELPSSIIE